MKNQKSIVTTFLIAVCSTPLQAAQEFDTDRVLERHKKIDKNFYLEYLNYEQKVHNSGKDVELGEELTKFEAAFKIVPTDDTFVRLRYDIDAKKNPKSNRTSKLEVLLNHRWQNVEMQADMDLRMDDYDRGATTFGPDTDSEYTFLAYQPNDTWRYVFYPYNFDGEVGRVFYTYDVTRIFYIDGTPDFISNLPVADERIKVKTLPGFEVQYFPSADWEVYAGVAAGRYLYPNRDDFVIEQNTAAERWEARRDVGYKAGFEYRGESTELQFEYVTHTETVETGALLETGASLQLRQDWSPFRLYFEASYSKAGENAYNLNSSFSWFEETTPFRPIFTDISGNKQKWLGEKDFAYYTKLSYQWASNKFPYVSYKRVGDQFVYWEEESVHRLRTADLSESHGGLDVYGLGIDLQLGNFTLTPEFEYKIAANRVFGNKLDLREDRELEKLNERETALTLYATYSL